MSCSTSHITKLAQQEPPGLPNPPAVCLSPVNTTVANYWARPTARAPTATDESCTGSSSQVTPRSELW